jgi:hypothetical protein
MENAIQDGPGPIRGRGSGKLLLELTQNLRFSYDHRIQTGRDPEHMPDRFAPLVSKHVFGMLPVGKTADSHEPLFYFRNRIGLGFATGHDLHAIAGRQNYGLMNPGTSPNFLQQRLKSAIVERQTFTHLDRGRMVA